MYEIIDKVILLISCLSLYLLHIDISYAIVPVILVVLLSCIFIYYEDKRIKLIGNLIFLTLCIWKPDYIIFLPILMYDIFHTKYQFISLVLPLLLLFDLNEKIPTVILYTLIHTGLAYVLKRKTDKLNTLKREYNELRDDSSRLSRILEEKNHSLLKNQDYEVNMATLNERNRISRELHDNIGHLLSRALLQVGALLTITKEELTKEGLSSLKESLSGGMDDIRNTIHKMHDESIDLYAQIQAIVNDFTFCPINYEYDIKTPPSLDIKYCLIAIVKEALSNIIKHSNASRVNVLLREHPAMYQLIIEDNGTMNKEVKDQFLNEMNIQGHKGMGLRNISDRVKGFDGNMNISLDKGFQLFIIIPRKNRKAK
ncbi:MAG: sensor histidine kinase [Clostridiales bacterium]|jgi:signal transduction histidine kinase|nr:sensor histidine kinase [Clostridiales bacterium]